MAARVCRRLIVALLALPVLAGCGGGADKIREANGEQPARSDRLVDFTKKPPFVNALDRDPADGTFLLTTNRGFFRVSEDGETVTEIKGTVAKGAKQAPIGTFLELKVLGPGRYIGSGHPDTARPLPPYLGFIRSDDAGKTWRVVSRLGQADLHQIRFVGPRKDLYAFDAVLGAILVSKDEGRTWTERFTPRQLVLDFVVDPEDPKHLLASTDDQLYRSENGGDTWRPADTATRSRLAWPAPDALLRADQDGTFLTSKDGGRSWERTGRIAGEPYKLLALDAQRVFVALSDGSIVETADGGRTWKDRFRP